MMLGLGDSPCVQWNNGGAAAVTQAFANQGCAASNVTCQVQTLSNLGIGQGYGTMAGVIAAANQSAAANGGCLTGTALATVQALAPGWVQSNSAQAAAVPTSAPAPTPAPVSTPITSTPAMIPGAGTSAAMSPTPSPTPSAIQPVTSAPVVPTPAPTPGPSSPAPTSTTTSTSGSTIIPGIPDNYVYIGGAAVLLLMFMGGKK